MAGHDLDRGGPLHLDVAAVGGAQRRLAGEVTLRERGGPLFGGGERSADDELVEVLADDVLAAVAQQLQVGAVHINVPAAAVEQCHGVARLHERRAEEP